MKLTSNNSSDELPVQLSLPEVLRTTGSRQYLASLALLGKGKTS